MPFDYGETLPSGQHERHPTLSESDKSEYVRPVRHTYRHLKCGTTTTMGSAIAETYAKKPNFYGKTFCCVCRDYFPVGADGEFVWIETDGTEKGQKVGT